MLFRECNHMWQAGRPCFIGANFLRQTPPAMSASPRHRTPACSSISRGFTLIEMAIVALVIMIIVAIAVPLVIQYMRMYRVGIASRNVATALQRARYLATSDNTRAETSIRPNEPIIAILQYNTHATTHPP